MANKTTVLKPMEKYIDLLDSSTLSAERKDILQPLIDFINSKTAKQDSILLNFICTHNSRRSHLAQVWAQTMATYFKVINVLCYSGGTEATALFPMIAKVLAKTGFGISSEAKKNNPIYRIQYAENTEPIIGFSKKYDAVFNPKSGFAAIMTCSQADEGCPFVAGSEKRISINYEDPKISDGTPKQERTYLERSEQIATEMKYVFSKINL